MTHIATWLVLAAACAATALLVPQAGTPQATQASSALLIFFAALPLVNVIFDWLSVGVTRGLLARTAAGHAPWLNSALDALAAIALLVGLAVASTAALQGLNTIAAMAGADRPLIDLAGVLQTLRDRPGDPAVWWVYFMLFSTLVPSIIHVFVAAGAVLTLGLPAAWLERHRQAIETGFAGHRAKLYRTARFMTFRHVLAFLVGTVGSLAFLAIFWGLHLGLPQLSWLLLWAAESTAAALGAPVVPGPMLGP